MSSGISTGWLIVGFVGQFVFFMRFLVQWIYSEIRRESLIPIAFWYFSIVGSLTLLSYALYRRDPVFIVGQMFGVVVYGRNLYLIYSKKRRDRNAGLPGGDAPPPRGP
jgi:lipid-A-disaccharide synthase-like uncharacterized protein